MSHRASGRFGKTALDDAGEASRLRKGSGASGPLELCCGLKDIELCVQANLGAS
jgi:hypothetical protein